MLFPRACAGHSPVWDLACYTALPERIPQGSIHQSQKNQWVLPLLCACDNTLFSECHASDSRDTRKKIDKQEKKIYF